MLNALLVLKEAKDLGADKNLIDVNILLDNYDYPALRETERGNYRVELYNKTSDINGISASKIMQDVPEGGEVYLIYVQDKLVYLQKHDPEQIGFVAMTAERATAAANTIIDNLVEQVIDTQIYYEVLQVLLS